MPRIVSLLASSTEIVCALGFGHCLVGRSHECDYPPEVQHLPVCTEVKFAVDGTSYQIDQRLKAIVQEGLSVYRVHADRVAALRPDLIITQIQCDVCAVSAWDVQAAVCELVASKPKIISLEPNRLADVWKDIRKVAIALEAAEAGERLIAHLKRRINEISSRTARQPDRPGVAFIEWIDPLMTGGNWIPELIALAGGVDLFGTPGVHAPNLQPEALLDADPDVLFIAPCGFDLETTRREMRLLSRKSWWRELTAVQQGRLFIADGNRYFNRPGPRLVESLEIFAAAFHPAAFTRPHSSAFAKFSASS